MVCWKFKMMSQWKTCIYTFSFISFRVGHGLNLAIALLTTACAVLTHPPNLANEYACWPWCQEWIRHFSHTWWRNGWNKIERLRGREGALPQRFCESSISTGTRRVRKRILRISALPLHALFNYSACRLSGNILLVYSFVVRHSLCKSPIQL